MANEVNSRIVFQWIQIQDNQISENKIAVPIGNQSLSTIQSLEQTHHIAISIPVTGGCITFSVYMSDRIISLQVPVLGGHLMVPTPVSMVGKLVEILPEVPVLDGELSIPFVGGIQMQIPNQGSFTGSVTFPRFGILTPRYVCLPQPIPLLERAYFLRKNFKEMVMRILKIHHVKIVAQEERLLYERERKEYGETIAGNRLRWRMDEAFTQTLPRQEKIEYEQMRSRFGVEAARQAIAGRREEEFLEVLEEEEKIIYGKVRLTFWERVTEFAEKSRARSKEDERVSWMQNLFGNFWMPSMQEDRFEEGIDELVVWFLQFFGFKDPIGWVDPNLNQDSFTEPLWEDIFTFSEGLPSIYYRKIIPMCQEIIKSKIHTALLQISQPFLQCNLRELLKTFHEGSVQQRLKSILRDHLQEIEEVSEFVPRDQTEEILKDLWDFAKVLGDNCKENRGGLSLWIYKLDHKSPLQLLEGEGVEQYYEKLTSFVNAITLFLEEMSIERKEKILKQLHDASRYCAVRWMVEAESLYRNLSGKPMYSSIEEWVQVNNERFRRMIVDDLVMRQIRIRNDFSKESVMILREYLSIITQVIHIPPGNILHLAVPLECSHHLLKFFKQYASERIIDYFLALINGQRKWSNDSKTWNRINVQADRNKLVDWFLTNVPREGIEGESFLTAMQHEDDHPEGEFLSGDYKRVAIEWLLFSCKILAKCPQF